MYLSKHGTGENAHICAHAGTQTHTQTQRHTYGVTPLGQPESQHSFPVGTVIALNPGVKAQILLPDGPGCGSQLHHFKIKKSWASYLTF